jgi:hypothetical protein
MGGMLSVLKVRDDVKRGDYRDPGWFNHPAGTLAYEYTGPLDEPARGQAPLGDENALDARKPDGHAGHEGH